MAAAVEPVPVQVNMQGFNGKPCSLLGVFEPETGVFLAHKITPMATGRIAGCFVIGTGYKEDCDCVFTASLLGDAIKAYDDMRSLIEYTDAAKRCNPDSAVQTVSYEANGAKKEISETLSNEKAAMLAACWALGKQNATNAALSALDYMRDNGGWATGGGWNGGFVTI